MSPNNLRWLIGAKIACCVGLLLVVSGALSLAAVGTFLTGNALPLVGGGALILLLARVWQRRRTPVPSPRESADVLPSDRGLPIAPDS